MGKYAKFWLAAVGFAVVVLGHYAGVNNWLYPAVVSALTSAGVYAVPNAE